MSYAITTAPSRWRNVATGLLLAAGVAVGATQANAGECPADKRGVDLTKPVTYGPKDVTDMVLGTIDVAKEQGLSDRLFRLRKLEVKPGGVVPWHSHAERPALIYVVKGQILEYSSDCAVPILHKAGDVSAETKGVAHWWKNEGTETVVLISADLLKDKMDKSM
jgi:quercetin dioxygenase-like cupin family protein